MIELTYFFERLLWLLSQLRAGAWNTVFGAWL